MDILNEFGIKPILLLAQVVNFLVLLYLLKRFLYQPILKVLADRKEKIAESLKNAEEIESKLIEIEEEKEKKLVLASKEAKNIIEEATQTAQQVINAAHLKAKEDFEKLSAKSAAQLKLEQEKFQEEMRNQLVDLVVAGLKSVTGKIIDQKDQKDLINKSLKGLND